MDPLLERCGDLKQELVAFATSDRFDAALQELIFDEFPDGVIDDELSFALTLDGFIHGHRLAAGTSLIESFINSRPDLSAADRAIVCSWLENVQGTFEIVEMAGDDGFVAFNHVDELTYRMRSNMGAAGVSALSPGMIVIGRIVPVSDFWMISGPMASFPADQAEDLLAGVPQLQASHPEAVFRNPEKLEQGRRMQTEQRADFIAVHGSDTVVVPGAQVREVLMAAYRHTYERHGSVDGPWTEPDFPLPEAWTDADSVGIIYDELDGLGFYIDYTVLIELFTDPALLTRRRYRETLSGYLRDDEVSPVPIARLAADDPDNASRLFAKLLKKPGFSWDRDGEAVLRRNKKHWYDNPPLPRIVPVDSRVATRVRSTPPKARRRRLIHG
ncbi:hypothetical protein [Nocardia farcinica]|uniref:hypothetical protein n=1 Tax=Nocardia farcinica TaxID=37329 RepID=UPI002454BA5D|nr:hypothetical protein [Nocardia farcinica]